MSKQSLRASLRHKLEFANNLCLHLFVTYMSKSKSKSKSLADSHPLTQTARPSKSSLTPSVNIFSLNGLSNAWFMSDGTVSIGIISAGGGVLYKITGKR